MYEIYFKKQATKDLDKLNDTLYDRIRQKLLILKDNPRCVGSLKLTNEEVYRVRVGGLPDTIRDRQ
jgi:mRNA-degrading endonuclease RelE of RelBE toxin-antitoxin system